MRRHTLPAALLALSCLGGGAVAQTAPAAQPARPPVTPETPVTPATASKDAVAKVQVIEDDSVRIEEKRLRGAPQRITVRIKAPGGTEYEIIVPPGGKDPSQDKGAAGRRAWSVLSF